MTAHCICDYLNSSHLSACSHLAQRKAAWFDLMTSSDQKLPPIYLCNKWGRTDELKVGTGFCIWQFLPPERHLSPCLSCPRQPELPELGAGVMEGNAGRTSLWMALMPSIHPKKKKGSSVNKSIPTGRPAA